MIKKDYSITEQATKNNNTMNYEVIKIELLAAFQFTSFEWKNQTRYLFNRWSTIIASEHYLLLEDVTKSDMIYNWYLEQFRKVEMKFYQTFRFEIKRINAPDELYEAFEGMIIEIENIFPQTLINTLKYGQTVPK